MVPYLQHPVYSAVSLLQKNTYLALQNPAYSRAHCTTLQYSTIPYTQFSSQHYVMIQPSVRITAHPPSRKPHSTTAVYFYSTGRDAKTHLCRHRLHPRPHCLKHERRRGGDLGPCLPQLSQLALRLRHLLPLDGRADGAHQLGVSTHGGEGVARDARAGVRLDLDGGARANGLAGGLEGLGDFRAEEDLGATDLRGAVEEGEGKVEEWGRGGMRGKGEERGGEGGREEVCPCARAFFLGGGREGDAAGARGESTSTQWQCGPRGEQELSWQDKGRMGENRGMESGGELGAPALLGSLASSPPQRTARSARGLEYSCTLRQKGGRVIGGRACRTRCSGSRQRSRGARGPRGSPSVGSPPRRSSQYSAADESRSGGEGRGVVKGEGGRGVRDRSWGSGRGRVHEKSSPVLRRSLASCRCWA